MTSTSDINQLVFIVVSGHQSDLLKEQLTRNKFYFTEIDSSGGVLQDPTACLLVGFNHARMPALLKLVRQYCRPYRQYIPTQVSASPGLPNLPMIEAQVGGALVYAVNVERFEQF
jgi:uncharacterized protein YaaQ